MLWSQRYVAVATSLSKVFAALFVCFELICHDAMSPEGVGNAAGRTSTSGEQVSRWVLVDGLREARRELARSSLDVRRKLARSSRDALECVHACSQSC